MKNIINLIKINLLTFFDFYKIKNAKNFKEARKSLIIIILMVIAYIYLGFYVYFFASEFMEGYQLLNISYLLPTQFMVITSTFILFSTIYKVKGILFEFKDYDLLMSLPIDKKIIVISKLITLYVYNLIFTLLIMVPAFIAYIKFIPLNFPFVIYFFITLFIIPLVPIIMATFIGSLFSYIGSFFKKKNVIDIIIPLAFIGIILYFQTRMINYTKIDIANIGQSLIDKFNHIYPLTSLYTNIIKDFNFQALLFFITIPIVLWIIYILVINKLFSFIHFNLNNHQTKAHFKMKELKTSSPIKALYYKELKRYFASSIYVLNTAIIVIMLTFASIGLIIFGADKINSFIGYADFSKLLNQVAPLIIGLFCAMTCTTNTSISMEGKSLWIIKYLPISQINIFNSKILVNLTITIPAIIINSFILGIYLKLTPMIFLLCFIIPILYSLFTSITGIIINLLFPSFNWDSEVKVIKQSMSATVSLFFNMLISIVPIVIITKLKEIPVNHILWLITVILAIMVIISYYLLKKYGPRKFLNLN
jgi:ABC-2 type transport system permease protein